MLYKNPPKDFNPKFQIAFCICAQDNEILLLQRQKDKGQAEQWGVPAGKLEENETAFQAAKREIFEETGLHIPSPDIIYITKIYDRYPTFDFTMNIFSVTLKNRKDIVINATEHKAFRWVSLEYALDMDLMQDVATCLKRYYKSNK